MANSNTVVGFATSGTVRNTFPTQAVATTTETAIFGFASSANSLTLREFSIEKI